MVFLDVKQTYRPSSIYSCSTSHIWEHEIFSLGHGQLYFWPRFYIVVLWIVFFFIPFIYFPYSIWTLISLFYLGFYFPLLFRLLFPFFVWTFISLFCLEFSFSFSFFFNFFSIQSRSHFGFLQFFYVLNGLPNVYRTEHKTYKQTTFLWQRMILH